MMVATDNHKQAQKTTSRLEGVVNLAASIGAWIGSACVIISMMLIVINVVGRKFFQFSLVTAQELSQHLLVAMTFLGLAFALKEGAHVEVQVVTERLGNKARKICQLTSLIVGLCFCVYMSVLLTQQTIKVHRGAVEVFGVLHTPLYLVQMFMPIGFLLFTLTFVVEILKACRFCLSKATSPLDAGKEVGG